MPRRLWLGRVRSAVLARIEYARRVRGAPDEPRVVVMLGMHRSGTSALAGTLQEAGLYLGNVRRRYDVAANAKGTRENMRIVRLHEAILAESGGSWHEPPERIVWSDADRVERDHIVDSYAGAGLWGFKEPRAVLFLDFWHEALGDRMWPVGIFRDPVAVVESLLRRDGGAPAQWFALWARYNGELLRAHEEAAFPLLEFGGGEPFREQVVPVLQALGLRVPRSFRFFDPRLTSDYARASSLKSPPEVARLYERLQSAQHARGA